MAPRCRGKRQLRMSRGKELASLSYYHFRIHILHALRFLIQRFQTHCPPCEVKIDAKVPQKVTPKNTTLRKPCGLIYRFHIKHCGIDLFKFAQAKTQLRKLQKLYILRY